MNGAPKQVAEGGLRLRHAALGAGDLGRVARQEVVHRLLRRQLRDGRQHAEGVGGQQHDVARVARRRRRDVAFGMWLIG